MLIGVKKQEEPYAFSELLSIVANTPSEAPVVSIATVVTVVVTVDIMADNQALFGIHVL